MRETDILMQLKKGQGETNARLDKIAQLLAQQNAQLLRVTSLPAAR